MTMNATDPVSAHTRHILNIVRDILLVVLGAGLALAAEEWRDRRAIRHRQDIAITSVRAEIAANLERVKRAQVRHRTTIDTLQSYQTRHAVPSDSLLLSGVFNPAHPLSTAWETARDTKVIGEFPYAIVLRLSALYEQQEQYSRISAALDEALTIRIESEGLQTAFLDRWTNLIFLNKDFMGRAEGLDSRYTRTLAFLDSARAPVSGHK